MVDIPSLIDHQRYPIDDLAHPESSAVIRQVQDNLRRDGCALLKGFLSTSGLDRLLQEAQVRRPQAYFSPQKVTNVYLSDSDGSFDADHPVNFQLERTNGFVTSDNFGEETASWQLYHWAPLREFLAGCLEKERLYIYDDPVSNMIVNVCSPGTQFNWHFDTNEFTITMLLKPARQGGYFEYVPGIRSASDENYGEVARILNGSRDKVKRLNLQPGDMQIFLGRYSLHQVTRNTGNEDRLLIIMSFTERPGVIGSRQRVQQLYGKTMDVHQQQKVRSDQLRD